MQSTHPTQSGLPSPPLTHPHAHTYTNIHRYTQLFRSQEKVPDNLQLRAKIMSELGNVWVQLGHTERGVELYTAALGTAQEAGDPERCMRVHGNLGLALKELGELSQAEEQLQSTVTLARELEDSFMEGRGSMDLAAVYRALQQSHPGQFEIIHVPIDRDEVSYKKYVSSKEHFGIGDANGAAGGGIPWLSLPFGDRDRRDGLVRHIDVKGLPTLAIVDTTAKDSKDANAK